VRSRYSKVWESDPQNDGLSIPRVSPHNCRKIERLAEQLLPEGLLLFVKQLTQRLLFLLAQLALLLIGSAAWRTILDERFAQRL